MTALLGLLAVAGFQNRDKIAEIIRGMSQGSSPQGGGTSLPGGASLPGGPSLPGGLGGMLGGLGGLGGLLGGLAGSSNDSFLNKGLGELVDKFKQSGQGEVADSWVGTGHNKDISPTGLEQALGPEVIEAISRATGLPVNDLLAKLSKELPSAIDRYTPQGRLPS